MKVLIIGLISGLLSGLLGAAAQGCSVDQRIELAKAGYDKAEVEALCAADMSAPAVATPGRTPDEVLSAATYDADDNGPFKRIFATREKCEFLSDMVRVNNNKKTFGGYYSKLMHYSIFDVGKHQAQLVADRGAGTLSASISMTAWGLGAANETCYALLIRRQDIAPEVFDAAVAGAKAEFDAVRGALIAKGVEFD
jgi:hypothetical protein